MIDSIMLTCSMYTYTHTHTYTHHTYAHATYAGIKLYERDAAAVGVHTKFAEDEDLRRRRTSQRHRGCILHHPSVGWRVRLVRRGEQFEPVAHGVRLDRPSDCNGRKCAVSGRAPGTNYYYYPSPQSWEQSRLQGFRTFPNDS